MSGIMARGGRAYIRCEAHMHSNGQNDLWLTERVRVCGRNILGTDSSILLYCTFKIANREQRKEIMCRTIGGIRHAPECTWTLHMADR